MLEYLIDRLRDLPPGQRYAVDRHQFEVSAAYLPPGKSVSDVLLEHLPRGQEQWRIQLDERLGVYFIERMPVAA